MEKILILGASGFIGNSLYRELHPFFDTYGSYTSTNPVLEENKKFFQVDFEQESTLVLLESLRPTLIISAVRASFQALIKTHMEIAEYVRNNNCRLLFFSSANVFDAFSNYPSYEYDKTLSMSVYGRFKIKIENALLRLDPEKYLIARLPMVYGANSPRVQEIKNQLKEKEAIEVFSNVVINATTNSKLSQQVHYLINHKKNGVFHLGSQDLVHHHDLVRDICQELGVGKPLLKNVYDSNFDRFLAVLPKYNLLPENLQISVSEVVSSSVLR